MKNDTFVIQGLGNKKTLNGEVTINGAKNAVLKIMAGSILFKGDLKIKNVPDTEDVKKMISILEDLGAKVFFQNHELTINTDGVNKHDMDSKLAQSMRASVVLTGPLLARFGSTSFPSPGGCVIGSRPIDLFIEGYKKMGANVEYVDDKYEMKGELKSAEIFFDLQTVGGTETLMMAAVLAKGKTILKNCAMEPEIKSVAEFLNACGANIKGAGTTTIEIDGGELLSAEGKEYITVPDRIEAGSFLILGALCADNLKIDKCDPTHLESLLNLLKNSGVPIKVNSDSIEIFDNGKIENSNFKSFNVRTHEYPGFPTDLQAPIVTYLTQTNGESIVFETIYEGRLKFVQNLLKLGASLKIMNEREVLLHGNSKLKNTSEESMDAFDIRAGFATVIASLLAQGESRIHNVYFIDRGYENLELRLAKLGANIKRVRI